MLKSIEGEYRDGTIKLDEPAPQAGPSRVVVTFLASADAAPTAGPIDLAAHDVRQDEAAALRASFGAAASDWDDPSMDVWDKIDWDAMPQLVFTVKASGDVTSSSDVLSAQAQAGRAP